LVRYGSRFYEKLAFKRQNDNILIAEEFALLRKNHEKRSKKYGTLCGRPKRSLAENGTLRYATVRYGTLRYATVRYGTLRYATVRYGTLRYATVRYGTLRYATVRYGTLRYATVRYGTVRYGTDTVDG
jgi:hypothetical protein